MDTRDANLDAILTDNGFPQLFHVPLSMRLEAKVVLPLMCERSFLTSLPAPTCRRYTGLVYATSRALHG